MLEEGEDKSGILMYIITYFFGIQNEGGRAKIELTGIAATEKSLRMMTGIASHGRDIYCCSAFLQHEP